MSRRALSILAVSLLAASSLLVVAVPSVNPPAARADAPYRTLLPLVWKPDIWWKILDETFGEDYGGDGEILGPRWHVDYSEGAKPLTWGRARYCRQDVDNFSAYMQGSNPHIMCGSGYDLNMDAWMVYGPFPLDGARAADLSFSYRVNVRTIDRLSVGVSTDNYHYAGASTSGDSQGWQTVTFDFRNFPNRGNLLGSQGVWLAFVFHSDPGTTPWFDQSQDGAAVDDIIIRSCAAAVCPGALSSSGLSAASAAADSQPVTDDWSPWQESR